MAASSTSVRQLPPLRAAVHYWLRQTAPACYFVPRRVGGPGIPPVRASLAYSVHPIAASWRHLILSPPTRQPASSCCRPDRTRTPSTVHPPAIAPTSPALR